MLLSRINSFISKYLILFILVTLGCGFYFSETLIRFSGYLPYFLMFMVFILGTSCDLQSFRDVVKNPKGFLIALLVLYIFIPGIGYGIGRIFYAGSPQYAVGHFLLAVSPVAITSMIWTGFIGGNLVLALSIISAATVLSGFAIPFQMSFFMGEVVAFDAVALMLSLLKMIVFPVIAGILVRQKAPGFVEKTAPGGNLMNKVMMLMILAVNGAAVNPYIDNFDWSLIRMFLIVALHLFLNYAVALAAGWKFLGKESRDIPSIVFASGMRNNAAGVVIALHYFGPEVALPVIICIFMQQLSAGGIYSFMQKVLISQEKSALTETE